MAVYGYARVSTEGQTLAAQEVDLHEAGAAKVFKEKISGTANHRAQLHRLLKTIDAGDIVIVTRLDRLARSTRDLLNRCDIQITRRRLGRHDHAAWEAHANRPGGPRGVRARTHSGANLRRAGACPRAGRSHGEATEAEPTSAR